MVAALPAAVGDRAAIGAIPSAGATESRSRHQLVTIPPPFIDGRHGGLHVRRRQELAHSPL